MKSLHPALVAALMASGISAYAADTYTPGEPVEGTFDSIAIEFLDTHCLDCHDDVTAEAELNLLELGPVDETNAALWKSVWAQVALREMPPKKKKAPETIERLRFADWVVGELERVMEDKGGFYAHLDPKKGNYVDHDLLFGNLPKGIKLKPTASPARIWRVTPQEHITRLNELINTEPDFDPAKPGLRSRGDFIPTNHGGELKLYFGTDRIIRWEGGTVAYATAVKSVPVVLSSDRKHGLENYPDFYSVNSAEATQIMSKAEDILKYMAYGPMSLVGFPEQITDDPKTYDQSTKPEGDLRGLPTAIVYNTNVVRPLTPVHDLMKESGYSDERLRAAVDYLFEALTFRPPNREESDDYLEITKASIEKVGKEDGAFMGLSSIFLDRDALFRPELATKGKPDTHGRVMLQDWEVGLAVNHALRYIKPDDQLREAIVEGRMRTREDVEREVTRMLEDDSVRKPRVLRFFRDYFDHDLAGYICKDTAALGKTGVQQGGAHYRAMFDAAASTDRLIELILEEDEDVLKELLTTQLVVATVKDDSYFGRERTKEERAATTKEKQKAEALATAEIAEERKILTKEVNALEAEAKANKDDKQLQKTLDKKQKELKALVQEMADMKRKAGANFDTRVDRATLSGTAEYVRVSRRSFGAGSMKADRTLAVAPAGQRLGILTHPSWLVSHSDAMDNHAIHRGIWIRENLLGGGIPDVPITVDAQLPNEPQKTLRERMRVTSEAYCWSCHEKMDPLGLPFEMFNHAGLYRTMELDKLVDTSGEIIDSGDSSLDGPVSNAIEMIEKLAESERVEQVFVRHAFRFWMGRNETLNDAPVLQEAHRAYVDGGGSMNSLITSLLTSDAFLYRSVEH